VLSLVIEFPPLSRCRHEDGRVLWAAGGVAALVEELRTRGIYVGGLA
jgi:hypothetical protein